MRSSIVGGFGGGSDGGRGRRRGIGGGSGFLATGAGAAFSDFFALAVPEADAFSESFAFDGAASGIFALEAAGAGVDVGAAFALPFDSLAASGFAIAALGGALLDAPAFATDDFEIGAFATTFSDVLDLPTLLDEGAAAGTTFFAGAFTVSLLAGFFAAEWLLAAGFAPGFFTTALLVADLEGAAPRAGAFDAERGGAFGCTLLRVLGAAFTVALFEGMLVWPETGKVEVDAAKAEAPGRPSGYPFSVSLAQVFAARRLDD